MLINDPDFGEIIVRKNRLSKHVKFTVSTSGRLAMSVPYGSSTFLIKRFLKQNKAAIKTRLPLQDPSTQRARDTKKALLLKEARAYLPYRLDFWAKKFGYHYGKLRLSHANTRWGSRSSSGTISLNIGLMQLPEALRDYVILHELAHIKHMDHSPAFWQEVAAHDPNYKKHRQALKKYNPSVF